MKTSKQVEEEFRGKLQALLDEFRADIDIYEVGNGFNSEHKMFVHIRTVFNDDVEIVMNGANFGLGVSLEMTK